MYLGHSWASVPASPSLIGLITLILTRMVIRLVTMQAKHRLRPLTQEENSISLLDFSFISPS
jgi:hypothetical protein